MNEKRRVALAVLLWGAVALLFICCGVFVFNSREGAGARSSAVDTPQVIDTLLSQEAKVLLDAMDERVGLDEELRMTIEHIINVSYNEGRNDVIRYMRDNLDAYASEMAGDGKE